MQQFNNSSSKPTATICTRDWQDFVSKVRYSWRLCLMLKRGSSTVWVKKIPLPYGFLKFFPKQLGIFNQFFTHLLYHHFYTRVQIFIQLSPTLTHLYHTKRDHPAKFYISLLSLLTEQITSLLTTCHIQHVCGHYKSVYFIVTCHKQRSTKLSTTCANVGTRAFWTFCTYYVNWIVVLNMA